MQLNSQKRRRKCFLIDGSIVADHDIDTWYYFSMEARIFGRRPPLECLHAARLPLSDKQLLPEQRVLLPSDTDLVVRNLLSPLQLRLERRNILSSFFLTAGPSQAFIRRIFPPPPFCADFIFWSVTLPVSARLGSRIRLRITLWIALTVSLQCKTATMRLFETSSEEEGSR